MISSMTGYGKARCRIRNKQVTVEIRTLNSKVLDINLRIPNYPKNRELPLRSQMARILERGKVEVSLSVENATEVSTIALNKPLFIRIYSDLLQALRDVNAPENADIIPGILRLPEVLIAEPIAESQQDWDTLDAAILTAISEVVDFRKTEGSILASDIIARCNTLMLLLDSVQPLEENRITTIKAKLSRNLSELPDSTAIDPNRLEQELIYYLEKLDITEEKVRMANHLQYFLNTMKDEQAPGRKLGFIAQELGREINTIGSKASDSDIQKLVVQMKDELEKIKEQLFNVL